MQALEARGHSLPKSVELLRIMGVAGNTYENAKTFLADNPDPRLRIMRLNNFGYLSGIFSNAGNMSPHYMVLGEVSEAFDVAGFARVSADADTPYSFIDAAQTRLEQQALEAQRLNEAQVGPTQMRGVSPAALAMNIPHAFNVQPTNGIRRTTPAALGIGTALQARLWQEDTEPEPTETMWALHYAFTNAAAFNVARQMFLDGYDAGQIETAIAIGAAL